MEADILAPPLLGQSVDPAQIIRGQRRMIEIATVLISPFESVFAQNLGETVKKYCVVRANGVVSNRELQRQRDKRERNNASRSQIAFGVHPWSSSSFTASLERLTAEHPRTDSPIC